MSAQSNACHSCVQLLATCDCVHVLLTCTLTERVQVSSYKWMAFTSLHFMFGKVVGVGLVRDCGTG